MGLLARESEYKILRINGLDMGLYIFSEDFRLQNDFTTTQDFVKSIGEHFIPAYFPILQNRMKMEYGRKERNFQCYRRGRYVEFNLLYDRGTHYGLQSGLT